MEKYIYINYAYEDQQQVMAIVRRMKMAGINLYYGNGSEEKVSGSACVIHFCTAASRTSKSYRKIMNFTLKHEVDSMLFHLEGKRIASEVEMQLDALHVLFKYKYGLTGEAEALADALPEDAQPVAADQRIDQTAEAGQHTDQKQMQVVQEPDAEKREQSIDKPQAEQVQHQEETVAVAVEQPAERTPKEEPEKISEHDSKEMLFKTGKRLLEGDGCEADPNQAFAFFKQAASQGHVEAQYQLRICYDKGIGTRRNLREAAKWCQMAAYGGHVKAQSELGYCYEYGQGVVRNIKEAVRWYEMAAGQGEAQALNNLAFCYQKGRGVHKDVGEAIRLYQQAADMGHGSALYNLGFCYWYGEGVKADKPKAIELFEKSAAGGNAKAAQMLKVLNQHAYIRK